MTRTNHDPDSGVYGRCPCHQHNIPRAASGWHKRTGPGPVLAAFHGRDPALGPHAQWIDHAYRIRRPDGSWCWVAEPYSLDPDAFADFAHLEQQGFRVHITAWQARHYPGHTIAVHITKETR